MLSRFFGSCLELVIRHPKWVLLAIGLLLLAALAGLPRFKLDASADSLTLEHDSDLSYFREVSKTYGSGDFLVVTFNPKNADLFTDESLNILRNLHDDLAEVQGVSSVNSILNVPLLYSPKRTLSEVANKTLTLESEQVDRQQAKQEFLESPIYRELILSPDGQTTAIQLNIAVDKKYISLVQKRDELREQKANSADFSEADQQALDEASQAFLEYRTKSETRSRERVEQVRSVVAQYQDKAEIFIGGITMITADMISYIRTDLFVFGSAALIFVIIVLAVIFKNVRFVVIPMATCLTAVLLMLGFVSWLDWRLTVISSNFVALLLIISLAIIIHLVVRYREFLSENPDWTQAQLVRETIKFMALPCLYTVLTTIVAFVSLVVSDIRPVIDFGWMMTIGLVVAIVLAFLLLPASLMLLKPDRNKVIDDASSNKSEKPLPLYCSAFVEKHGNIVIVGAIIVSALAALGITKLQVENRFIDYFHEDTEIYQGLSVIDNKLGGTTSLDIIIESQAVGDAPSEEDVALDFTDEDDPFAEADAFDESDPFDTLDPVSETDPFAEADPFSEHGDDTTTYWMTVGGMQLLEDIHDYLQEMPEVGKVQSLAILYKVGQDLNGSLNNFELAVMDKSLSGDIKNVLVEPYLDGDTTRITMRVKDSYPGLKRQELVNRIKTDLSEKFNLNQEHTRLSGLLILYNNMLQSLFSSQIVTLGVVYLGILIMFIILFRSLLVALVAIIPNIIASLSILGSMGLFGIPLDMMTITVAAIAVGIGVDNTIHYIYRFRKEVSKDGDYVAAMHRSHGSIGRAMYYTSVIIIFGFSIMVLSNFIPTIYFGVLTGFAMLAALMGALFVLPKFLLMVKPFKTSESTD